MDPSGIFFTSHAGDRSLIRTRPPALRTLPSSR